MSAGISTKEKAASVTAFAVLVLLVFTKVLLSPLGDLDELWNYNLCRGTAMGYVPYKDYGMVMMPLFTVLFSIPLHLSRTLLMYRIASAVMIVITAFVYYRAASERTDRLFGRFLAVAAAFSLDIATYNVLFFMFLTAAFILLTREMNTRTAVVTGILCSLSVLCRQTSGVFLLIAVLLIFLTAPSLRKLARSFLVGAVAVMAVFAGCLLITGSFEAFWDCCLFALLSGGHDAGINNDSLLSVIIIIAGLFLDIYLWRNERRKDHLYHLIFGAVLISVGIPIVDHTHICYAGLWFFIPVCEAVKKYAGKSIKPALMNILTAAAALMVFAVNAGGSLGTVRSSRYVELRGIPLYDGFIDGYSVIDEENRSIRAEGNRVVILSSRACLFSIMDGRFDPPFDLFLTGNTGTRDPVSIVEDVYRQEDTVILMPDDYPEENWENPEGVYESVVSHCTPFAQYGNFVWYRPVG